MFGLSTPHEMVVWSAEMTVRGMEAAVWDAGTVVAGAGMVV